MPISIEKDKSTTGGGSTARVCGAWGSGYENNQLPDYITVIYPYTLPSSHDGLRSQNNAIKPLLNLYAMVFVV
jgi:hypothetical protein